MKITLVLLVAASLLLLFGCAGGKMQKPSQGTPATQPSATQQEPASDASALSELDLLLIEEGDAAVPIEDMPVADAG